MAICGGFTSKNWDGSDKYINDSDAFLFNMKEKYAINNPNHAIYTYTNGFSFGNDMLTVKGSPLNHQNKGECKTGKDRYYNIEEEVSPLTY